MKIVASRRRKGGQLQKKLHLKIYNEKSDEMIMANYRLWHAPADAVVEFDLDSCRLRNHQSAVHEVAIWGERTYLSYSLPGPHQINSSASQIGPNLDIKTFSVSAGLPPNFGRSILGRIEAGSFFVT